MSVIDGRSAIGREAQPQTIRVNHFIRGKLVSGDAVRHTSRDLGIDFTTPAIDLDALITPRSEMPPLFDVKLSQIVDFLVEVGERLDPDHNPYLQESLEFVAATNPLPRRIIENLFRRARHFLTRDVLMASLNANFHDPALFRRMGVAHRRAGAERSHSRLSAAHDPHARRQLAGGLYLIDRAGRDAEGDQRLQDALERPVLLRRGAAHHGGYRSGPSGRAIDVRGLLARR